MQSETVDIFEIAKDLSADKRHARRQADLTQSRGSIVFNPEDYEKPIEESTLEDFRMKAAEAI